MATHLVAFLVFAALVLASVPVLADIAPRPGYIEECTVKAEQKSGEECRLCGAWHGKPKQCEELASQGYQKRCRTQGASTWGEVWCRLPSKADVPLRFRSFSDGEFGKIIGGSFLTLALVFGGFLLAPKIKGKNVGRGAVAGDANAEPADRNPHRAARETMPGKQHESDSHTRQP